MRQNHARHSQKTGGRPAAIDERFSGQRKEFDNLDALHLLFCAAVGLDAAVTGAAFLANMLITDKRSWKMLACERSQNTVSDTLGEFFRPLVDGLIRDADYLGCGDYSSAEKFNGFRFEHATLNHGSMQFVNFGLILFR